MNKPVTLIMQPIRRATSCDGTLWQLCHMWGTDDSLMIWRADPGCAMEQFFRVPDNEVAHLTFDIFVGTQLNSG